MQKATQTARSISVRSVRHSGGLRWNVGKFPLFGRSKGREEILAAFQQLSLQFFMLLLRSSIFVQKKCTRAFMGLGSSTAIKSMSIFDHTVQDMEGKEVALSQLKGAKAYLVINVASK